MPSGKVHRVGRVASVVRGAGGSLLQGVARMARERTSQPDAQPIEAERSITIGKPADELGRAWRDPQTLARSMAHAAEISVRGDDVTHWKAPAPDEGTLEWDARVVEDRPGELVRWASVLGAEVSTEASLSLRRAPAGWGTVATLRLRLPDGAPGAVANTVAFKALRRFKSLVETGEIPTLERNPSARPGAPGDAI